MDITKTIISVRLLFSLHGAYQLELDFLYVRTWLSDHIQNQEVKQSVLCLDAFKNLMGIVCLLKRQPRGRTPSRARDRSIKEDRSMCMLSAFGMGNLSCLVTLVHYYSHTNSCLFYTPFDIQYEILVVIYDKSHSLRFTKVPSPSTTRYTFISDLRC